MDENHLSLWMRSSRVVRASDSQCSSRNCPRFRFDPSILRHSEIWGATDEAVSNIVHKKRKKSKNVSKHRVNTKPWNQYAHSRFLTNGFCTLFLYYSHFCRGCLITLQQTASLLKNLSTISQPAIMNHRQDGRVSWFHPPSLAGDLNISRGRTKDDTWIRCGI